VVEYYLTDRLRPPVPEDGGGTEPAPCTVAHDRAGVEAARESLHEEYYAVLHRRFCSVGGVGGAGAAAVESVDGVKYGVYTDGSFPPFLGRIVPTGWSAAVGDRGSGDVTWEIRRAYVIPALHWIVRGLVASGHLERLESAVAEGGGGGGPGGGLGTAVVITNHAYYCRSEERLGPNPGGERDGGPYDVLDVKEMVRRKRSENAARVEKEEEEEEEVEMSAYEKMRAERVARNKERLKLLGLG